MVTIGGIELRRCIALFVGCCLFVAEGINYSQLAPFFPTEAETKKGLDEFLVGIVNSSFDIATIFFTAVLAVVATPELNKFFFLWGAVFGAVALICFGVLALGPGGWWYFSMCVFCRVLMGIGANMLWSTGIPLLTSLAPEHSGKITSLTESGVGLGFAIGPPVGSLIYSMGGYVYPFLCCGLIEVVLLMVAVFTIPGFDVIDERKKGEYLKQKQSNRYNDKYDDDSLLESEPSIYEFDPQNDDVSILPGIRRSSGGIDGSNRSIYSAAFKTLLSYPGIWCVSSFLLVGSIPFGAFNVAMGPFLLHDYNIQGDSSGFYFLIIGAVYSVFAQLVGFLVDKGFASYIFFWNNLASVAVMFTFGLPLFMPELGTKAFLVLMLALNGLIESATFVPLYVIMEQIACNCGYAYGVSDLRLKIAIWINFVMSVGKILGSVVLGGVVCKHMGFYWVILITAALFLFGAIISNVYIVLSRNYRRMYYHFES